MKINAKKLFCAKNIVLMVGAFCMLLAFILMFTIKASTSVRVVDTQGSSSFTATYEYATIKFGECFKGGFVTVGGTMVQKTNGLEVGSIEISREFAYSKGKVVGEVVIFIVLAIVSALAIVGSLFVSDKHPKLRKLIRVLAVIVMGAVVIETLFVIKGAELIDFRTPIREDIIKKGESLEILNHYGFNHKNACPAGIPAVIGFVVTIVGMSLKYPKAQAE